MGLLRESPGGEELAGHEYCEASVHSPNHWLGVPCFVGDALLPTQVGYGKVGLFLPQGGGRRRRDPLAEAPSSVSARSVAPPPLSRVFSGGGSGGPPDRESPEGEVLGNAHTLRRQARPRRRALDERARASGIRPGAGSDKRRKEEHTNRVMNSIAEDEGGTICCNVLRWGWIHSAMIE